MEEEYGNGSTGNLTSPETSADEDAFKTVFKMFKSFNYEQLLEQGPPSDISVININESGIPPPVPLTLDGGIQDPHPEKVFGLKPASSWKISRFKFPEGTTHDADNTHLWSLSFPGLVFIRNPFTTEGQRYWISTCLREYVNPPHVTNISNLEKTNVSRGKKGRSITSGDEFYKKLRWVTFGYHHNWDTKVYSEDNKCDFPQDLYDLTRYMGTVLGFQDFKAEAAIVNYYNFDSTLSGHQDRSEENLEAPLFSISFGQSAVFLIGGETKDIRPAAIHLQSGDVVVMSGKSRLSYHGVPKIIKSEDKPWISAELNSHNLLAPSPVTLTLDEPNSKKPRTELEPLNSKDISADFVEHKTSWEDFSDDYAGRCRINLNVRQKH